MMNFAPVYDPIFYKLRIHTATSRRSDLQNRHSRINLCLINKEDQVVWKSFAPYEYNIKGVAKTPDEIQLALPDIGVIDRILLSPESDTWNIESVEIETCHQKESFQNVEEFSCLFQATDPTKTFDEVKYEENMTAYSDYKKDIVYHTVFLTIIGTTLLFLFPENSQNSMVFGLGGISGIVYQTFLQKDVDMIGKSMQTDPYFIYYMVQNILLRFIVMSIIFYSFLTFDSTQFHSYDPYTYAVFVTGFFMNKIAMVLSTTKKISS